ncbi:LptF/LptG family permease [Sungkyunkwania multivorans]|uniref:LptF/LptG family permease n=1 Tax=Sungkyunkwania multivorans TaxID=1173618 RepID=A0ABW3CT25_9FLAO
MKILDRYIFTTYIKTFLSVFLILIFIFILQTVWLFIKDLAGKGLDFITIIKFLWYYIPKLIPLVLPLTILLSSIMTFGNFAENYEFAAMKSTGISLQRAMGSLIIFIAAMGISSFFFANNVIPASELKVFNMRRNLAKMKPALAIEEGQFNDIININIKVGEKYGENDQFLKDVIIHQKSPDRKNHVVIKATKGELRNDEENDMLQLILTDGNRYEDIQRKTPKEQKRNPHAKAYFEKYTMNIDLSSINDVDIEAEGKLKTYRMQKVNELTISIDTLTKKQKKNVNLFGENIYRRTGILALGDRMNMNDSVATPITVNEPKSLYTIDTILSSMDDWRKVQVLEQAINSVKNQQASLNGKVRVFYKEQKLINLHKIEFHKKIALGFACIILFFVGAPLGAIIRKGGMGLPMVFAIVIFLAYHFIGIFGENSAEDGTLNPALGGWLSTLIMFPLSVYLTRRATTDQGLINLDPITEPVKKFFNTIAGTKESMIEELVEDTFDLSAVDTNTKDYRQLRSYRENKLKDIVQNYKKYGYDDTFRLSAIHALNEQGVTLRQLKLTGKLSNKTFDDAESQFRNYKKNSTIASILWVAMLVFNITVPLLKGESNIVNLTLTILGVVSAIGFFIYLIVSYINYANFFDNFGKEKPVSGILFWLLGALFLFVAFYYRDKMKESFKVVSTSSEEKSEKEIGRHTALQLKKLLINHTILYLVAALATFTLLAAPSLRTIGFGVFLNLGLYAFFGYFLLTGYLIYKLWKANNPFEDQPITIPLFISISILCFPLGFVSWILFKKLQKQ